MGTFRVIGFPLREFELYHPFSVWTYFSVEKPLGGGKAQSRHFLRSLASSSHFLLLQVPQLGVVWWEGKAAADVCSVDSAIRKTRFAP